MKQQRPTVLRRVASHEVMLPSGESLLMEVVEIAEGRVVRHYPLGGEPASTEWLPGQIVLKHSAGGYETAYYQEKPLT